jgi:uncharacterized membrane protein
MYHRTSTERALGHDAAESGTQRSDSAADSWTLAMWTFETCDGADLVIDTLLSEQRREDRVITAGVAQWPQLGRRPGSRTVAELSDGVLTDMFWSTFFGVVFYLPLVGAALGTATRRPASALGEAGIDDEFVNQARDRLVPGTSALFLLTTTDELYGVVDAAAGQRAELTVVSLAPDQMQTLTNAFGPTT